jgi:hypothetical protein
MIRVLEVEKHALGATGIERGVRFLETIDVAEPELDPMRLPRGSTFGLLEHHRIDIDPNHPS